MFFILCLLIGQATAQLDGFSGLTNLGSAAGGAGGAGGIMDILPCEMNVESGFKAGAAQLGFAEPIPVPPECEQQFSSISEKINELTKMGAKLNTLTSMLSMFGVKELDFSTFQDKLLELRNRLVECQEEKTMKKRAEKFTEQLNFEDGMSGVMNKDWNSMGQEMQKDLTDVKGACEAELKTKERKCNQTKVLACQMMGAMGGDADLDITDIAGMCSKLQEGSDVLNQMTASEEAKNTCDTLDKALKGEVQPDEMMSRFQKAGTIGVLTGGGVG